MPFMKPVQQKHVRNWPAIALVTLGFAFASGLVFAGWFNHGNKILWTMLQSSIAWCF